MAQNPFDDLVPKQQQSSTNTQPQQAQANSSNAFADLVPKTPAEEPAGPFMTAVEGFNRSFGRTAEGVLQLVAPILPQKFNEGVAKTNRDAEIEFARDKAANPIAGTVGEVTGYIGQGLVTPTAKGGALARIASNTLAGAGLGGIQYGTNQERLNNAFVGGVSAGLLSGALEGVQSLVKPAGSNFVSRMLTPEKAATQDLVLQAKNSGGINAIEAGVKAAKELGENITPAEAMGGRLLPATESSIHTSNLAQRADVEQFLNTRDVNIQNKVTKLINDFVPEGEDVAKATREKLYNQISTKTLPDDITAKLQSNPVIADELNTLNSASKISAEIKDLPDNSVLKLDKIKQQIDKQLYKNSPVFTDPTKTLLPDQRIALQEARADIVNTIDSIHPEYAQARQVAERLILKKNMMEDLSTVGIKAREINEVPLDKVYTKLWGTPEKQEYFLDAVQRTGGDTTTAKNVLTFVNQIRNSPLETVVKKESNTGSVFAGSGPEGVVQQITQKITSGRYNSALLKLTLDNRWQEPVTKALEKQDPGTMMRAFNAVLEKAKNSKLGWAIRRKLNPNIADPTNSMSPLDEIQGMPIQEQGFTPRARLRPEEYMGAERRIADEEMMNANRYRPTTNPTVGRPINPLDVNKSGRLITTYKLNNQ